MRGKAALGFFAAAIGLLILNGAVERRTLPEGAVGVIRNGLATEYRIRHLADHPGLDRPDTTLAAELLSLNDVQLVNVRSKGWGFSRLIRVDVLVSGEAPPDGRTTRYLFLQCDPIIDCVVLNDISGIRYTLGIWFAGKPMPMFPTVQ